MKRLENTPGVDMRALRSADNYFRPFCLACEMRSTKMRALALEAIEKMICE